LSRGPGHVVRAIRAAFDSEPTRVFTIEDLCARVYARADRIEKKHRVSLIRAAKRVLERDPAWHMVRSRSPGASLLFFNETFVEESEIAGPPGINGKPAGARQRTPSRQE
jgi:hypothetical protein